MTEVINKMKNNIKTAFLITIAFTDIIGKESYLVKNSHRSNFKFAI